MLRMKSLFAVLLLTAIAGVIPALANPTPVAQCDPTNAGFKPGTPKVQLMIAGSSAMWQTMALGAYDAGNGITGTAVKPLFHFVSKTKSFNMQDTRPNVFGSGNPDLSTFDNGQVWIVWDNKVTNGFCTPNVWAYISIDSVAGNRGYFGSAGLGSYGAYIVANPGFDVDDAGATISNALWGDGSTGVVPPTFIQNIFTTPNGNPGLPNLVNVGATDVRPEDAYFAENRVNSVKDTTNAYQGLGYGINPAGTAPDVAINTANNNCSGTSNSGNLVGTALKSDLSATIFNVLAFNIIAGGQDPFTCDSLPSYKTISVGAAPIVVIHSSSNVLKGLKDATSVELGQVFSGQVSSGSTHFNFATFSPTGDYAIYVREPLSGTYNTFEETIARHPSTLALYRATQETGVDPVANNPLGGLNNRYRAIGTGEVRTSILNSNKNHSTDGIGYMFFSYGNVSALGDQDAYSYMTINGVDPIWHNYIKGTAGITDNGQPATAGWLPKAADTPCGSFPCNESQIWSGGLSFPNLRNGSYQSWSLLRLVATAGAQSNAAQALVNQSNKYVVTTVPDYVPFAPVLTDPGLQVIRSHFGCTDDSCGNNLGTTLPPVNAGGTERGRDAGGAIIPSTGVGSTRINTTQDGPLSNIVSFSF